MKSVGSRNFLTGVQRASLTIGGPDHLEFTRCSTSFGHLRSPSIPGSPCISARKYPLSCGRVQFMVNMYVCLATGALVTSFELRFFSFQYLKLNPWIGVSLPFNAIFGSPSLLLSSLIPWIPYASVLEPMCVAEVMFRARRYVASQRDLIYTSSKT
jgi:hypothetical protein